MDDSISFNARYISAFTPDRLYRIYLVGHDLCFIKIGGQGPSGLFQYNAGDLTARERTRAAKADADDPRYLATAHKHNLLVAAGDIAASSIDPPPLFGQHGPSFGRWRIRLKDGRKLTLQFEGLEDMLIAVQHLPAILGSCLTVNVEWDEHRPRFIARKRSGGPR